jgi:hypothetical protein
MSDRDRSVRRQHRRSIDTRQSDRQAQRALRAQTCRHGRRPCIDADLEPAGLDWITALRAPAIQHLAAEGGPLQLSLFDERDLAEIESPDFPGERLIVCKNPVLAEERKRKRDELLDATEQDLKDIQARIVRKRQPLRGADKIGLAVGALIGRRKSPSTSASPSQTTR